ncbi:MAG: hypothetical protein AB1626_00015 [Candidatus Micrarchaeota archaeon]
MNKINFALLAGGIALVMLALAGAASALSLQSSADSVTIRDTTEARVVIWFENQANEARAYAVQADASDALYVTVDPAFGEVAGRATKAVTLEISASPCLEGTFSVPVTVVLTNHNGGQETGSRTVSVQVAPARYCASYEHGYSNDNIYNGRHAYFDPSQYAVRITSRSEVLKMEPTLFRRVHFGVQNAGAAGSFELRLVGDAAELRPFLSQDQVALQRSEAKELYFDVHSKDLALGQYDLYLQVLHDKQVIAQKHFYFNVVQPQAPVPHAAALVVPQQDANGSLLRLVATVTNAGSQALADVTATVAGIPAGWDVLSPMPVDVAPGETKALTLYVRQNTDEGAEKPILVLTAGGNKIYEKQLPAIQPRKSGMTGLFAAALSQNMWIILGIVAIALLVALMAARWRADEEEITSFYRKQAYQRKLKSIRDAAGAPAPEGF